MKKNPEETASEGKRDDKVDILKGVLVVLMVFFHCASMVISKHPELKPVLMNLRFLHLAFLVTTGFVIGIHYVPYVESGGGLQIRSRLIWRGFRLLVTFLVINLGAYLVGILPFDVLRAVLNSPEIALSRLIVFPDGNLYATEVLLHIALFLMVTAVILRNDATKLAIICAALCLGLNQFSSVFATCSAGFLGLASAAFYRRWRADENRSTFRHLVPVSWLLFVGILSFWGVKGGVSIWASGVLEIVKSFMHTSLCFLGVVVGLPLLRILGMDAPLRMFGKYTLFSYIWQMILIRLIAKLLVPSSFGVWGDYSWSVFLACSVTLLSILLLERLRSESEWMNRMYKMALE